MMERTFADRLRSVIGDEDPTPWAAARGISGATMHEWLTKGTRPYPKTMAKLVAGTGIPAEWWLNGEGDPPPSTQALESNLQPIQKERPITLREARPTEYKDWANKVLMDDFVPVRYYSRISISAGHGALNHDHEPDALLFSRRFISEALRATPDVLLLVRVKGDSMYPTLQAGWTVMVDTSKSAIADGIYVVRLGEMEVCKRLEARPGGIIRVISDNKAVYEEYEINPAAVGENEFSVVGRVVWFAGMMN